MWLLNVVMFVLLQTFVWIIHNYLRIQGRKIKNCLLREGLQMK